MTTSAYLARFATLALATALATGCAAEADLDDASTTSAEIATRPTFDLFEDAAGEYRFHLAASNGEILVSSEGYSSRTAALNGILSVLDNAGFTSRYVVFDTPSGGAYFNLRAGNHAVIATSEIYASRDNAWRGVDATVRAVAAYLEHWDTATGARVAVHQDAGSKFYFNVHAGNGEIVLRSQRYETEAAALNGAFSVVENGAFASRFQVLRASNGGYYLNLVATNGQIIATSEVYSSKSNAERARDAIVALLPTIELL